MISTTLFCFMFRGESQEACSVALSNSLTKQVLATSSVSSLLTQQIIRRKWIIQQTLIARLFICPVNYMCQKQTVSKHFMMGGGGREAKN